MCCLRAPVCLYVCLFDYVREHALVPVCLKVHVLKHTAKKSMQASTESLPIALCRSGMPIADMRCI